MRQCGHWKSRPTFITSLLKNVRNTAVERFMSDLPENQRSRLFLHRLDVTKDDEVKDVVQKIIDRHKKIDVLINNAGICVAGFVETTELEQVRFVTEDILKLSELINQISV